MTLGPAADILAALIAQIVAGLKGIPTGSQGFVLTLETDSDDEAWLQVSDELINAAWPFEHEPEPLFPAVCTSKLIAFEPEVFATFALADVGESLLARWIAHYFVEILGLDPSIELTVAVEDHGPVQAP